MKSQRPLTAHRSPLTALLLLLLLVSTEAIADGADCTNGEHSTCNAPWSWEPGDSPSPPIESVELPRYPGCFVSVEYRYRDCPDPNSILPVTEVEILGFRFSSTTHSDPDCAGLVALYGQNKEEFARFVFDQAVRATTQLMFERESDEWLYSLDNPQPGKVAAVICGPSGGQKTYRVIQGSCWRPYFSIMCPPGSAGTERDEKEAHTSMNDWVDGNCLRVRRGLCSESEYGPCCIEELNYCRDLLPDGTWGTTHVTRSTHQVGEDPCDPNALAYPKQGEWYGDCVSQCDTPPPSSTLDNNKPSHSEESDLKGRANMRSKSE